MLHCKKIMGVLSFNNTKLILFEGIVLILDVPILTILHDMKGVEQYLGEFCGEVTHNNLLLSVKLTFTTHLFFHNPLRHSLTLIFMCFLVGMSTLQRYIIIINVFVCSTTCLVPDVAD